MQSRRTKLTTTATATNHHVRTPRNVCKYDAATGVDTCRDSSIDQHYTCMLKHEDHRIILYFVRYLQGFCDIECAFHLALTDCHLDFGGDVEGSVFGLELKIVSQHQV